MGREVGLTPALQAIYSLLYCCFLVHQATAQEMQQVQECTLGCTPIKLVMFCVVLQAALARLMGATSIITESIQ